MMQFTYLKLEMKSDDGEELIDTPRIKRQALKLIETILKIKKK